jgi:DNA-binding transcriptional LysR family regulator
MDLDQLHTFLEIVRLKSFSKAAQTCYRTQPAISAQVRQLELELNTTLFERYGTRISLTVAGRILAEHAEQILALRRKAQDAINELEKVPRGELVIAANEATCIYVLPGVFAEFKKQFPNVQLLVDRSYGTRVVQAVLDNLADFGITQLPVQEKKLQVVKIHSDEIKLLVPPGHRLAGTGTRDACRSAWGTASASQNRHDASTAERVARFGSRRIERFHGIRFNGNDQAIRHGEPRLIVFSGLPLPGGRGGGQAGVRAAGTRADDPSRRADLPEG